MQTYVLCKQCARMLKIASGKIDDDGDLCLMITPCGACLLKARQQGENSVPTLAERKPATDDTEATDEPLSAKQVRRELCALEGRLARLIRDVHERLKVAESTQADAEGALEATEKIDARLKAAESTQADAEDAREATEKSTSQDFGNVDVRLARIEDSLWGNGAMQKPLPPKPIAPA